MPNKSGAELEVGNVLDTWSGQYSITGFDPHPGLPGPLYPGDPQQHHTARIVKSGEWGMTIFDDDVVWLMQPGVWTTSPEKAAVELTEGDSTQ